MFCINYVRQRLNIVRRKIIFYPHFVASTFLLKSPKSLLPSLNTVYALFEVWQVWQSY